MPNKYVILEGPDFSGKSTAVQRLSELYPHVVITRHPGATPLGALIRRLTKTPEYYDPDINLDTYAEQLLMVIDIHTFTTSMLRPGLAEGRKFFADRCNFLSGLAYGVAGGLSVEAVEQMFALVSPVKACRLYLFDVDVSIADTRKALRRGPADRFDDQTNVFVSKVREVYRNLMSNPAYNRIMNMVVDPADIVHIDGNQSPEEIVTKINNDLKSIGF